MIHVPVKFFAEYTVELSGKVLKTSICDSCRCEYVYEVTRSAVGRVNSPLDVLTTRYVNRLLRARAEKRLARKFKDPDLIACPVCGWYQADMVRHLRKQRFKTGMIVTSMATFVILGVAIGVAFAIGIGPNIAIIATAGAFSVGIVCTGWYTARDPNDLPREVDRTERAKQSRGLTIEAHRRREQVEQAERLAREEAFANAITREQTNEGGSDTPSDFPTAVGDDDFSFSELGRAALKASRQRQERIERARRGKVGRVCAVVTGACAGVVVDATFFGANFDDVFLRIIAALFLGIFCGLAGYAVILRFLGGVLNERGPRSASPLDIALHLSVLTAGLPATWAAAGMEKCSAHGYACAIACEALALFIAWQFGRREAK